MDTKAIQNLMNKAHSAVPTAAPGAGLREAVMGFGVVPGVAMASIPLAAAVAGQMHRFVDDKLADVEHRQRHQGADQAQAEAGQGQRGAGSPHLPQERRQVAQGGHALAQARAGIGCLPGHGWHCAASGAYCIGPGGSPSPPDCSATGRCQP